MSASHTLTNGCEVKCKSNDSAWVYVILERDAVWIEVVRLDRTVESVAVPLDCVLWLRDMLGRMGV